MAAEGYHCRGKRTVSRWVPLSRYLRPAHKQAIIRKRRAATATKRAPRTSTASIEPCLPAMSNFATPPYHFMASKGNVLWHKRCIAFNIPLRKYLAQPFFCAVFLEALFHTSFLKSQRAAEGRPLYDIPNRFSYFSMSSFSVNDNEKAFATFEQSPTLSFAFYHANC